MQLGTSCSDAVSGVLYSAATGQCLLTHCAVQNRLLPFVMQLQLQLQVLCIKKHSLCA
jgi:hypothetical protein